MRRSTFLRTTCVLTTALLTSQACWADFTQIPQKPGTTSNFVSVFEAFYSPGDDWAATGDRTDGAGNLVDFSNGSLLASRIHDFGYPGVQDMGSPFFGDMDDQSWTGSSFTFRAVARYASYTQEFGYDLYGDDEGYVKLFDLSGAGMNVSGSASLALQPGDTLSWYRSGNYGGAWSSRTSDNADGVDHMVAYRISGFNDDVARWMLFWEDLPKGGDKDYRDLVVEVTAAQSRVPEPGVGITLVLCGGAYVLLRRRGM